MNNDFAIEAVGLSKTYQSVLGNRQVHALADFNMAVRRGSVFGLLGPNGAGKTTLVKILLGLVKQSAGVAYISGVDTRDYSARSVIGFLPENHRFPAFLTGVQMLKHYGRLSGIEAATVRSRIPHLLEQVNMTKWGDTKIKQYSKGMMQRIGLAQSLVNDPDIVFLDEPTDGVDPVGRREIRGILQVLRDEGKTIFLNSHLLSEVEQICSEVAILNNGSVIASGTIDELTRQTGSAYSLTIDGGPPAHAGSVEILGKAVDVLQGGIKRYAPKVKNRDELNALIDSLRSEGIKIEAISATKKTLEDSFIDLLDIPENTR